MFRSPPKRVHVVYSIHDPDLPICADTEEYQKTLDPSHLCNVEKLTPIELHNLTVAQRLDLKGRAVAALRTRGVDGEDDPRFWLEYPRLCALQVRAALRAVGDIRFDPDATGYVSADALDLLEAPEVVEEIAGYVEQIAHLGPPGGQAGDSVPSDGASPE